MTGQLLAWHGDAALKKATVAEMAAHRKADRLVKGQYWRGGKGCAVGCLVHSGDHAQYEPRFGIPRALAQLEDTIFENLPNADAMKWPERFLKAAKPGTDLSLVQWQFLAFVVEEALSRKEAETVREACQPALEVVRARARGETVSRAELAARSAELAARSAWSAARSAAWSAARSAWSAELAARSAAWSAELAARSAELAARSAWSAAESAAAESAARAAAAAWKRYAGKLIELMAAAPVAEKIVA